MNKVESELHTFINAVRDVLGMGPIPQAGRKKGFHNHSKKLDVERFYIPPAEMPWGTPTPKRGSYY